MSSLTEPEIAAIRTRVETNDEDIYWMEQDRAALLAHADALQAERDSAKWKEQFEMASRDCAIERARRLSIEAKLAALDFGLAITPAMKQAAARVLISAGMEHGAYDIGHNVLAAALQHRALDSRAAGRPVRDIADEIIDGLSAWVHNEKAYLGGWEGARKAIMSALSAERLAAGGREERLAEVLREEQEKFQQETRRTSDLSEMLRRFIAYGEERGCRADPTWVAIRNCPLCSLMVDATKLLETPVNLAHIDTALSQPRKQEDKHAGK